MHARIRVMTRGGRELDPGSLEAFTRLVADGDVSEGDLIYDALTGEWAPALVHPIYRYVRDRLAGPAAAGAARSEGRSGTADADLDRGASELGLSLAPAAPEPTPQEAAAAFIEQMAAERAEDPECSAQDADLRIVGGGSRMGAIDVVFPEAPRAEPGRSRVVVARGLERSRARPAAPRIMWMLGSLMAVTAAVTAPAVWRTPPLDPVASSSDAARVSAREGRRAEDTSGDAAMRAVLADAHSLLEELEVGPIPQVWLEGAYLADAASHAEVRAAWERYLAFVWAMRANEERRYREAYTAALDDEGVVGPARAMRLGSALRAFRDARAERETAYERVEELAVAALSLHDLLVHLSGSIRYVPAVGAGIVSDDPAIEAVGVDGGTQQLLDDALDRVTLAIEAGGRGPATREHVPEWVEEQLRSILTW